MSMGQVSVTLNGRTYSLRCADGEESRLLQLAAFVTRRADALVDEFGMAGDDRVLLLAAIMIADELMQAKPAAIPAMSAPAQGVARSRPRKSTR
jgi:cell division protein ZapA